MAQQRKKHAEPAAWRRRDLVRSYWLRGARISEMVPTLHVSRATIYRDINRVKESFKELAEQRDLYSLQLAMARLEEAYRDTWEVAMRPPAKEVDKHGEVVTLDDSFRKLVALGRVIEITHLESRLCGLLTPKQLERVTMVDTTTGKAIRVERIPMDEQLRLDVERLRNDEGFAKSRGLTADDIR